MRRTAIPALLLLLVTACEQSGGEGRMTADERLPVMRNDPPPFHYPPALYAQKVQGNVVLRLWVDSLGQCRPESTRVVESSGYPALDSAAVTGARQLAFSPAIEDGAPVSLAILFPVYFRHPDAAPLPGDSVLQQAAPAAPAPVAP
ncbi:MAG TPA: energy transducer TonB [Gemmatimonadaceae bacterium]|jgi:TonB family protein|nr:energy transducer TonB [Gemmatimonadaceae bacterium]